MRCACCPCVKLSVFGLVLPQSITEPQYRGIPNQESVPPVACCLQVHSVHWLLLLLMMMMMMLLLMILLLLLLLVKCRIQQERKL